MFENLKALAAHTGKPEWRDLLVFTANLHERSIIDDDNFPYPWEHLGPGYCYGPGFGHWDLIHELMDQMEAEPENVKLQLLNDIYYQQENGFVPGCIYVRDGKAEISTRSGHPPVWVFAADRYYTRTGDTGMLETLYNALIRQIDWFRNYRHADGEGYYYFDIINDRIMESGVDDGVRFINKPDHLSACVDATAHMFALCDYAVKWAQILGKNCDDCAEERDRLGRYIRETLYDPDAGWFYDAWLRNDPNRFPESYESFWPMIVGAATPEQAKRVRDRLMDPEEFYGVHPVTTVSRKSPRYEMRMWRGPAWNSMTYWAVQGLLRYGMKAEAKTICERVLDSGAKIFAETGDVWEFYHPDGNDPHTIHRKPYAKNVPDHPCSDYLGHNPYIDMALIWESID